MSPYLYIQGGNIPLASIVNKIIWSRNITLDSLISLPILIGSRELRDEFLKKRGVLVQGVEEVSWVMCGVRGPLLSCM